MKKPSKIIVALHFVVFLLLIVYFYPAHGDESFVPVMPPIDWSKEYFVISLLDLYGQYEKECYADSTNQGWGVWLSDMEQNWWMPCDSTAIWCEPFERYSHKEPTFKGFIEFVKTKKAN